MSKVLVIRNDAKEGAGLLGSLLDVRGFASVDINGWDIDYARLSTAEYAALVVLGGAQGAYETDTCPYLGGEIKLIQSFVDHGKPVIGICLGAQLLATALGGSVQQNTIKEVGWYDIMLSDDGKADALMASHPAIAPAFHFHGDFFETPPGCTNLAGSELTRCQVFRYGDNVYGFQYHVEVDMPLLEIMCVNNSDYITAVGSDAEAIIAQSTDMLADYEQRSSNVMSAWIDMLEGAA